VRTPAGSVEVDPTGKRAGRGAYLCDQAACWQAKGLRQRLGAALNTTVSDDDYRRIAEYANGFTDAAADAG
jgi:predicted RNA-binding protein YlxR (DUF448 family)